MSNEQIVLTDADRGRRVELSAGGQVALRLPENATTGYRWAVDRVDGPLRLSEEVVERPKRSARGAEGFRVLTFVAEATGNALVALELRREWESTAADHFEFTVTVA